MVAMAMMVVTQGSEFSTILLFICLAIMGQSYNEEMKWVALLRMKVKFDESCLYGGDDPSPNKLFGIGFGPNRCIRFLWRSNGNKDIQLMAYTREGKEWNQQTMLPFVNTNEEIELIITTTEEAYIFSMTLSSGLHDVVEIKRQKHWLWDLLPYRLYPYFGGSSTAPHDMTIEMVNY